MQAADTPLDLDDRWALGHISPAWPGNGAERTEFRTSLQSAGPATRSAGAMDTAGRIFGAAATKHFESASTSERNQRAAEQRVRVAASPLICL